VTTGTQHKTHTQKEPRYVVYCIEEKGPKGIAGLKYKGSMEGKLNQKKLNKLSKTRLN
jgi:hypothetical protein